MSAHLWEIAFVVQEWQYADRLLGDEVEHRLVVLIVDGVPLDALLRVLLLLQLEDVLVEVVLQRLIGVVDA